MPSPFPEPKKILDTYPKAALVVGRADLVSTFSESLLAALRDRHGGRLQVLTTNLAETGVEGLKDLITPELFPQPHCYRIVGAKALKAADRPMVEAVVSALGEEDFLLMEAEPSPGGHGFSRTPPSGVGVISLKAPTGRELISWVEALCRSKGLKPAPDLVRHLPESADGDLQLIATEVEKLSLAFGNRPISLADALPLLIETPHQDVFALLNALLEDDREQARRLLKDLLAAGHHPLYLLTMAAFQIRTLLSVRHQLDQGLPPGQVARNLRRPPKVADDLVKTARGITYRQLVEAFDRLVAADLAMKSTPHPPELLLEGVLFALFSSSQAGYSYWKTLM